jgi:hexosaminidase
LPEDVTVLEWGYEADHPFAEHAATFASSRLPFYMCPGTSSWNSIGGRTDNCLANIDGAVRHGLANGATGCLVTDWGDNGHWQHLPASYLGFAAGAALSWCYQSDQDVDLPAVLDRHALRDRAGAGGSLLQRLGRAHEHLGRPLHNSTVLFRTLRATPDATEFLAGVDPQRFRDALAEVNGLLEQVSEIHSDRPDAELVATRTDRTPSSSPGN